MNLLLENLEILKPKKVPHKVSLLYLKSLCLKYYLNVNDFPKESKHSWNGAYKGILEKIGHDYDKFEQFIKYYILINKALNLYGIDTGNFQTFNIFNLKKNLKYFLSAIRVINTSKGNIDYIWLKFKIEEDLDGRCEL